MARTLGRRVNRGRIKVPQELQEAMIEAAKRRTKEDLSLDDEDSSEEDEDLEEDKEKKSSIDDDMDGSGEDDSWDNEASENTTVQSISIAQRRTNQLRMGFELDKSPRLKSRKRDRKGRRA